MKCPQLFNPEDGRTLWFGERKAIREYDVEKMKWKREVAAPPKRTFVGPFVVLASGAVVTGLDGDELVVLGPKGKVRATRPLTQRSLIRLGDRVVAFAHDERRFVVMDERLREVQSIAHADDELTMHALPSGREWIAASARGQWHHFGERPRE